VQTTFTLIDRLSPVMHAKQAISSAALANKIYQAAIQW